MRRWWNGWLETRSFSARGESLWAAGRKGDFSKMIPREVRVVFEDCHTRASGSLDSRLRGNDGKRESAENGYNHPVGVVERGKIPRR